MNKHVTTTRTILPTLLVLTLPLLAVLSFFIVKNVQAQSSCADIKDVRTTVENQRTLQPNQPFICMVTVDANSYGSATVACGAILDNSNRPNKDICPGDRDRPVSWQLDRDTGVATATFNCIIPNQYFPDSRAIDIIAFDSKSTCTSSPQKKTTIQSSKQASSQLPGVNDNDDGIAALVKKLLSMLMSDSPPPEYDDPSGTNPNDDNTDRQINDDTDSPNSPSNNPKANLVLKLVDELKKKCPKNIMSSNVSCVRNIVIPDANQRYLTLAKNEIILSATQNGVFQCVGFVQAAYFLTDGRIPERRTYAINYRSSPGFITGRNNRNKMRATNFCVFDMGTTAGHIAYLLNPDNLQIAEGNFKNGDVHIRSVLNDPKFLGCAPFP